MGKVISFKGQKQRWFKTDPAYGQSALTVDAKTGIIPDVSVCSVGEAKGHGVQLEQSFVDDVVRLGNEFPLGIKCRFGHPSMSTESLGTYLGRFKNFRTIEGKAIADLHLDEISRKAPGGDLYGWLTGMVEKNPDMLGPSIVFEPGDSYQYDDDGNKVSVGYDEYGYIVGESVDFNKPIFASIVQLYASDIVDDPAANEDGMFKSSRFNADKFAVQVSEFLDMHPQVWNFIEKHPEKCKPFLQKYAAFQAQKKTKPLQMSKKNKHGGGFFSQLAAALLNMGKLPVTYGTIDTSISTGENIRIVCQGDEPAVEDEVYIVSEDGSETPAPDGDHTIASGDHEGKVISVVDGKITAIKDGSEEPTPETQNPPIDEALGSGKELTKLRAQVSSLTKQLSEKTQELESFKKNPLDEHTEVGASGDPIGGKGDKDSQFWNQPWNKNKRK